MCLKLIGQITSIKLKEFLCFHFAINFKLDLSILGFQFLPHICEHMTIIYETSNGETGQFRSQLAHDSVLASL